MSVDFSSKDDYCDVSMGYGAFYRLRIEVASRLDAELGALYADVLKMRLQPNEFNRQFNEIANKPELQNAQDVIDFLCMPDCDGEITAETCARIAPLIDGEEYDDFYELLQYCAENQVAMQWH